VVTLASVSFWPAGGPGEARVQFALTACQPCVAGRPGAGNRGRLDEPSRIHLIGRCSTGAVGADENVRCDYIWE
jgi:hypothetical protein